MDLRDAMLAVFGVQDDCYDDGAVNKQNAFAEQVDVFHDFSPWSSVWFPL